MTIATLAEANNLFNDSSGFIAAVAGVVVGGVIKIINKLLDRRKERLEEHIVLRKELREELDAVKEELHMLQKELDEWKEKYYSQVELTNALKLDVAKLTDELNEYKQISGMYHTFKPEEE